MTTRGGGAHPAGRFTARALPPVLALFALLTVVTAQGQDQGLDIRIGMILPSPTGDGVATQIEGAVAEAARQGIEMAEDELGFNAQVLGHQLEVIVEEVADAEGATEAARRLAEQQVLAIAGGYGDGVAQAIAEVAQGAGVAFLNIGSPSPALRNERCRETTFHIEPSGGMYLDALAGWYVGAGFRDWYLIRGESEEQQSLEDRLRRTLRERHFGARIVGSSVLTGDRSDLDDALRSGAGADVVLLLVGAEEQVEILARADALGLELEVTGFPWPETQTREYYALVVESAPNNGAGHRASVWEPTLDAYGARELNARFLDRFAEPMDGPAWAAYQAVKLPYEAITFGGERDAAGLVEAFTDQGAVFDVWKGIGVSFRPWNHQLRQSLFLVELQDGAENAWDLALLVGELPAIYMPRTDPVERLDQLGDLQGVSECRY